jgi:hypothetical protein
MKITVLLLLIGTAILCSAQGWNQKMEVDLDPAEIGPSWIRLNRFESDHGTRRYATEDGSTEVVVTIRYEGIHAKEDLNGLVKALNMMAHEAGVQSPIEKVGDDPLSYEYQLWPENGRRRYSVIGSYWLEVEQKGKKDLREAIITAYVKKMVALNESEQMRRSEKPRGEQE